MVLVPSFDQHIVNVLLLCPIEQVQLADTRFIGSFHIRGVLG
jgi:hypothetical protein